MLGTDTRRDPLQQLLVKRFWKALNFLSKMSKSVPTLTLGDMLATTEIEKADLLNSLFHSCFDKSQVPILPY